MERIEELKILGCMGGGVYVCVFRGMRETDLGR